MTDTLTQYGVALGVIVIVLREVFNFLKEGKSKKNGNSCITREEFDHHKAAVQYKENCKPIVDGVKAEFRAVCAGMQTRHEDFAATIIRRFDRVERLIRNGDK